MSPKFRKQLKVTSLALLLFIFAFLLAVFLLAVSWGIDEELYGNPENSPYILPLRINTICIQSNNTLSTHKGKAKYGFDFLAPVGTKVYASRGGKVIDIKEHESSIGFFKGNYIDILHEDSTVSVYYHLIENGVIVEVGDIVRQGQLIGVTGWNGRSLIPHIHIHVRKGDEPVPVTFSNMEKDGGIPRFLHCY